MGNIPFVSCSIYGEIISYFWKTRSTEIETFLFFDQGLEVIAFAMHHNFGVVII